MFGRLLETTFRMPRRLMTIMLDEGNWHKIAPPHSVIIVE
jgi:hypothetical protein